MDPTDLRAGLAERLAGSEPIDAQTFNSACFMLSRALEQMDLSVPEAAPLVRRLLRVIGRVVIDTGLPDPSPDTWPNTEEMALQWIAMRLFVAWGTRCAPVWCRPGRSRRASGDPLSPRESGASLAPGGDSRSLLVSGPLGPKNNGDCVPGRAGAHVRRLSLGL
jgi:hypothetical protein